MPIKSIYAVELLDSRGNPTVGCRLGLSDSTYAISVVPSGASTGIHEAFEWRDNDSKRYFGKGVLQPVAAINDLYAKALQGQSFACQHDFDNFLCDFDGDSRKATYGANVSLALSQAYFCATAKQQGLEVFECLMADRSTKIRMPVPYMNVVNGGAHADNRLDVQEFMLVPHGFACFADALRAGSEVHSVLGQLFVDRGIRCSRGDEGGYAPDMDSVEAVLDLLLLAIKKAGYSDKQVGLAIDFASSAFFHNEHYTLGKEVGAKVFNREQWVAYIDKLTACYPIISVEDVAAEDDWKTWVDLTDRVGDRVQLVGDDLFVTQVDRLVKGIDEVAANAILIKPNQVGTVSQTLATIELAKKHGYRSMVSHRSGESEDVFIADLVVGLGCGQIKAGPARQQDRVAKYNRLLWIESIYAKKACYSGLAL